MKLVSILDEELILEHLRGEDRQTLYGAMLARLAEYAELDLDIPKLTADMIAREDETRLPYMGVALPHLRMPGLRDLFIVIGLPEHPVKLKSGDATPTEMIFLSLIADNMSDVYLKAMAALARHLAVPKLADGLLAAARGGREVLWNYLHVHELKMKKVVTAEDVMTPAEPVIPTDAPLAKAFDLFNASHRMLLPVVDGDGRLAGQLSALAVVKSFIPDYVFMMDNLNFLNNFEVFNRIFNTEHSQPVARYMNSEPLTASPDTPLIQLTLHLTKHEAEAIYIVDGDRRLLGVFTIDNLIHKVLRG